MRLRQSSASNAWSRRFQLRDRAHQISEYSTLDLACKSITSTLFGGARVSDQEEPIKVSRVTGNFNRIARDLDRAKALAGFSSAEELLWQQAREASWSSKAKDADPTPFKLNFTALAKIAGRDRSWLSKQFARMVSRRVFVEIGDGSYLINKDYREWLDSNDRKLLTDVQVEWCMRVAKTGRTVVETTQSGRVHATVRTVAETPQSVTTADTVQKSPRHSALESTPQSGPPPYRNAGAINTEIKDESRRESNTPPNPPGGAGVCVSVEGGEPIPIEDAPPPTPRRPIDPAALARVEEKAERLFPTRDFDKKVRATAGDFPLEWIDRALTDMHAADKASWPFLLGILRRMDDDAKQGRLNLSGPSGRSRASLPASRPVPLPPPAPRAPADFAARLKPPTRSRRDQS